MRNVIKSIDAFFSREFKIDEDEKAFYTSHGRNGTPRAGFEPARSPAPPSETSNISGDLNISIQYFLSLISPRKPL